MEPKDLKSFKDSLLSLSRAEDDKVRLSPDNVNLSEQRQKSNGVYTWQKSTATARKGYSYQIAATQVGPFDVSFCCKRLVPGSGDEKYDYDMDTTTLEVFVNKVKWPHVHISVDEGIVTWPWKRVIVSHLVPQEYYRIDIEFVQDGQKYREKAFLTTGPIAAKSLESPSRCQSKPHHARGQRGDDLEMGSTQSALSSLDAVRRTDSAQHCHTSLDVATSACCSSSNHHDRDPASDCDLEENGTVNDEIDGDDEDFESLTAKYEKLCFALKEAKSSEAQAQSNEVIKNSINALKHSLQKHHLADARTKAQMLQKGESNRLLRERLKNLEDEFAKLQSTETLVDERLEKAQSLRDSMSEESQQSLLARQDLADEITRRMHSLENELTTTLARKDKLSAKTAKAQRETIPNLTQRLAELDEQLRIAKIPVPEPVVTFDPESGFGLGADNDEHPVHSSVEPEQSKSWTLDSLNRSIESRRLELNELEMTLRPIESSHIFQW